MLIPFWFSPVFKSSFNQSYYAEKRQYIIEKVRPEYQQKALADLDKINESSKRIVPIIITIFVGVPILILELLPIIFFTRPKVKEQFKQEAGWGKERLVILLLVISLCFPMLAFTETITLEHRLDTGLFDYSDRGYMLFVPSKIASLHSAPLLICLPAVGIKAKDDINSWSSIAGEKGFVVLDLDMDYARITSFADVDALYARIMDSIDALAKQYPVSRDKLYIAGTSAGGMMSISLGLRYPESFIAIGVVSGAVLRFGAEQELMNAKGRRLYMVHGTKDEVVPIRMFYATREVLEKNGAIIKYSIFPNGRHPVNSDGYTKVVEWLSALNASIKH